MISGLVVVDKPAGWTSHDVVARCRRIFGQRRVGHSGTLDPGATGVLLVGLGKVTRLLQFLGELPKSYHGEVVLGSETTTLDDGGEVVATYDMASVTAEEVARAAAAFVGAIRQVPPMVSAVHVQGRRLHELARQGIEVERPSRTVTVHALSTGPLVDGAFAIDVVCSSGTYVRSLAADLGRALGGGAHLRRLRRTAVGSFDLREAVQLDELGLDRVLPAVAAVRHLPAVTVDEQTARMVGHGRAIDVPAAPDAGAVAVLDGAGELLAVYEPREAGRLKPLVVVSG